MSPILLIVGLGNPGSEYKDTRHNAGVWYLQDIAAQYKALFSKQKKCCGQVGFVNLPEQKVTLLIPDTYMNHSGQAVAACAQFYKIPPQQILIVHDELDLPLGSIKLKLGGGHGGHNGIKDVIQKLGDSNFMRLRIGIGRPSAAKQTSSYVLSSPPKSEKDLIQSALDRATLLFKDMITKDPQLVMNQLHQ